MDPAERDRHAQLRARLGRVWPAFFSRFGRLRATQLEAMGPIVDGHDCLVAAPTASGKTEAAAAPLLQRLLTERWPCPGVVFVEPTRALVNDLYRRLEGPVGQLGIRLARRTSDHPTPLHLDPPELVVTTPESIDSLLCRHPKILSNVRAVVLDEVHYLDGSVRGDHAAVLVARLRKLVETRAGARLQVVALSATIGREDGLVRRFLREPRIARVAGQREIEDHWLSWNGHDVPKDELRRRINEIGARKVLAFVNRREDAERIAGDLRDAPPFADAVYAHHGRLARAVREHAEKHFLERQYACCVATSTLELGIDIGDVDLVVLMAPPPDVSSFLQRIGRGNRRAGKTRVVFLFRHDGERTWYEFLLGAARRRELFAGALAFRPSVLVQQAVSLAFQNPSRFVTAEALAERLPPDVRATYPAARLRQLLAHVAEQGLLVAASGGRFGPSPEAEQAFDRATIHSNFDDPPGAVQFVDALTGEILGGADGLSPTASGSVTVGGIPHRVVRIDGDRALVEAGGRPAAPHYAAKSRPILRIETCQGLREHLGLSPSVLPVFTGRSGFYVFHFLGTLGGRILGEWLKTLSPGLKVVPRALSLEMSAAPPPWAPPTAADLAAVVRARPRSLAKTLEAGLYARHLPDDWLARWLEETLPPESLAIRLAETELQQDPAPALRQILLSLCGI
jgi:ATP-dependent Lhr-like helicase